MGKNKKDNMDIFIENMHREMAQKNYSINRLATMSGITWEGIKNIEQKLYVPRFITMEKIAETLGVPVVYMLMDNDIMKEKLKLIDDTCRMAHKIMIKTGEI